MTHKPSDEELNELIKQCHEDDLISLDIDLIVDLARAELQRCQQPASVPEGLSWEACVAVCNVPAVHEAIENFSHDATQDNAVCVIREMLKAAAYGREQAQWIAVSERLPDFDTQTLWLSKRGNYSVFALDKDDDLPTTTHVYTHWMPLPEPPKC